jgi:hypothetical protein
MRRLVLETSSVLYTLLSDAFLQQAPQMHTVAATIDAVICAATLDRSPEATAQAGCAHRLGLIKTGMAKPAPQSLDRFAALNPPAHNESLCPRRRCGVIQRADISRYCTLAESVQAAALYVVHVSATAAVAALAASRPPGLPMYGETLHQF